MKQTARTRNIILYILTVFMVLTGALSGESRAQSGIFSAGNVQCAVYQIAMGAPTDDEACTEEMIGVDTQMPVIRAVRPLRRAFRALLAAVYVCAGNQTAYKGEHLRRDEHQTQICAQGLVTTIQYIHDLDGKKSVLSIA